MDHLALCVTPLTAFSFCVHICCRRNVFSEPLLRNGHLFWLDSSGFQTSEFLHATLPVLLICSEKKVGSCFLPELGCHLTLQVAN
jgi:hypothetical protein